MGKKGESTRPMLAVPAKEFVKSVLPCYRGAEVTIHLGKKPTQHTYIVPKHILCKQSSYFACLFNGRFREGEEQVAELTEIDGVLSVRSFEMVLQWLCTGTVILEDEPPTQTISTAIEFSRLMDMYNIPGSGDRMAEHIKRTIVENCPSPPSTDTNWSQATRSQARDPNAHTNYLTTEHIVSAATLPLGHPVRIILAQATVEGFLRDEYHKFIKETQEIPGFALDVLRETMTALKVSHKHFCAYVAFKDPFSGEILDSYLMA
ncbi:uncharacterized protein BO80DRAFT_450689 [Aspergillus ibericus CBS 121593]|uniref:BTB domain-containing protein n=1 Tax=Aspergillus ibericus CBS 121593 TaxID=1448316 RepID=A0A395GI92_9EURO|nr:hypothetical protein BO80DRAFT_450689 [Aspergillus ibericus CBS 121593]RAK94916.1 hypothetical protein BO80DRAFT_450689 [Aspergillus ibericus CBS 121593]